MKHDNAHKSIWQWILVVALLGIFSFPTQAAIPDNIDYQGYVTDSGGSPITGTVTITFSLYNVDTGGVALWSDTQSVTLSNGLFDVKLGGAGSPFPFGLFDSPLWLGIDVASDGEMMPRIALSSAGFAHKADDALTLEGQSAGSLNQSAHVIDTGNPHSVTAAQTGAISSAEFTLHSSDPSAHHTRYTDGDAVTAMGPLDDTNPLNHERRTGGQVFNAVLSRDGAGSTLDADLLDGLDSTAFMSVGTDNWVNTTGDIMTGKLAVLDGISIGTATPAVYPLYVRGGISNYLGFIKNVNNTIGGSATGLYTGGDAYDTETGTGIGGEFAGYGGSANGSAFGSRNYAYAYGTSPAYGVYSYATGGATSGREWAFYGTGDGYFSGQVGIGTTNPTSQLEVLGSTGDWLVHFYNDNNSGGAVAVNSEANAYDSGTGWAWGGIFTGRGGSAGGNAYGTTSFAYAYGSAIAYGVYSNVTHGTTTGREWAFYGLGDSYFSGDVGIGTDNPASKLAIAGGVTVGSDYEAYQLSDGDVAISGKVGIGTATLNSHLEVIGSSPTSLSQYYNTNWGPNARGISIKTVHDDESILPSNHFITFINGVDIVVGAIRPTTSAGVLYATSSDARLKTNITDFSGGLDMVSRMKTRQFEFIKAPGKSQTGFIAQELQSVFPQAVSGNQDSDVGTDPMGVDYGRITPVLVSAIQELKAENEALKEEIKQIKKLLGL